MSGPHDFGGRVSWTGDVGPGRFTHIDAIGGWLGPEGAMPDGLHVLIRKDGVAAVISFENDVHDGTTSKERMRDVLERMAAAGYEIAVLVPVGMDLSGSMEGHLDPRAIASLFEDHRIDPDRRLGTPLVLIEDELRHGRLAARALLAAGTSVAETSSRQDENDRWNRAQGRRGGDRRRRR